MSAEWQPKPDTRVFGVFQCSECSQVNAVLFPLSKKGKVSHTCPGCDSKKGVLQKLANPMTLAQFEGVFNVSKHKEQAP